MEPHYFGKIIENHRFGFWRYMTDETAVMYFINFNYFYLMANICAALYWHNIFLKLLYIFIIFPTFGIIIKDIHI